MQATKRFHHRISYIRHGVTNLNCRIENGGTTSGGQNRSALYADARKFKHGTAWSDILCAKFVRLERGKNHGRRERRSDMFDTFCSHKRNLWACHRTSRYRECSEWPSWHSSTLCNRGSLSWVTRNTVKARWSRKYHRLRDSSSSAWAYVVFEMRADKPTDLNTSQGSDRSFILLSDRSKPCRRERNRALMSTALSTPNNRMDGRSNIFKYSYFHAL